MTNYRVDSGCQQLFARTSAAMRVSGVVFGQTYVAQSQ
jgi:hypothetical protein